MQVKLESQQKEMQEKAEMAEKDQTCDNEAKEQ